jgi:hypothetical protein
MEKRTNPQQLLSKYRPIQQYLFKSISSSNARTFKGTVSLGLVMIVIHRHVKLPKLVDAKYRISTGHYGDAD